jgi:hypothetical protein
MQANKNNMALSGEFAVLSQLALLGYDANMTLSHTKGVDILVSIPDSRRMYRLEVKTRLRITARASSYTTKFGKVAGEWMMSKKHETLVDPLLFYCFVIIQRSTMKLSFFVIPSKTVARYVKQQHDLWRKSSKSKTPTDIRNFRIGFKGEKYPIDTPTVERYENNWKFRR